MSIRAWRKHARLALSCVSEATALEADLLLTHVLDMPRSALLTQSETALSDQQHQHLERLLAQRCDDVPLAYLLGTQPFWSLELAVNEATLVPRADTEILVEQALQRIAVNDAVRIADLGTGSGAVALAIAHDRPQALVDATDISADALAVARRNARALGIANVTFREGDWFDALADQQYALIVSNPPYVESGYPALQTALRHEPTRALASGNDGLDDIRKIAMGAGRHLVDGGQLLLEHGDKQADAVSSILRAAHFTDIRCFRDLAQRPRVTAALFFVNS